MILHSRSDNQSRRDLTDGRPWRDELDAMVRSALLERVGRATPSPTTWERIRTRVERRAVRERTFGMFWIMGRYILQRVWQAGLLSLSTYTESWRRPQTVWVEWRFDPYFGRIMAGEYGFFFLRLAF